MAKRITVTALQPLHYEGRSHVPGAVFKTTPVDAASLKYRGKVKLGGQLSGGTVPEHPSVTRRMEPIEGFRATTVEPPMPLNEQPVDQLPAAEPAQGSEPSTTGRPRRGGRGGYNRRDMTAQPQTNDPGE